MARSASQSRKCQGVKTGVRANVEYLHAGFDQARDQPLLVVLVVPEPAAMNARPGDPFHACIKPRPHGHDRPLRYQPQGQAQHLPEQTGWRDMRQAGSAHVLLFTGYSIHAG